MARFTGVPAVPLAGLDPAVSQFLDALKQNVELLIGARGEPDSASRALLVGTVTVAAPAPAQLQALSSRGAGFTISGAQVPAYTDYEALRADVQRLATDVSNLRTTLDALIRQLRR